MIRPVTLTTYVLALALGFALFKVKYEVQSLEDNLIKIERQTALDTAAIHVYKASWSTETRPQSLAALAVRHLDLKPMTSAEIGSYDTLPLGEGPSHPDVIKPPEETPGTGMIAMAAPTPKMDDPESTKSTTKPLMQLASAHVPAHRAGATHNAVQLASLPVRSGAEGDLGSAGDASIDAVLQAMRSGTGQVGSGSAQ